jgi:filamentous hemagglutinin
VVKAIDSVPVLGTVVSAAIATAACGPGAPACIAAATVASDAVQAGGTSGKVGTAFKVAAIELGQAAAFNVVGSLTAGNFLLNVAGHAAVGCAFTAAGGGSCEAGAASAGLAALSTPVISAAFPNAGLEVTDMNRALEFGSALTASAVMGGVGSVIGGGKFQLSHEHVISSSICPTSGKYRCGECRKVV